MRENRNVKREMAVKCLSRMRESWYVCDCSPLLRVFLLIANTNMRAFG